MMRPEVSVVVALDALRAHVEMASAHPLQAARQHAGKGQRRERRARVEDRSANLSRGGFKRPLPMHRLQYSGIEGANASCAAKTGFGSEPRSRFDQEKCTRNEAWGVAGGWAQDRESPCLRPKILTNWSDRAYENGLEAKEGS